MSKKKMKYLDYAILKTLSSSEKPLWKKKIHEEICSHRGELPAITTVSVQTIGRHIDALREDGLVEPTFVRAEGLDRDFITGYGLTPDGERALGEKRERILKEKVISSANTLLGPFEEPEIEKKAVIELMKDEFEVSDDIVRLMQDEFSREELVSIIAMYYFNRQILSGMTLEHVEHHVKLIMNTPRLRDELFNVSVYDMIKTGLQNLGREQGLSRLRRLRPGETPA